jgi:hypothetical protein
MIELFQITNDPDFARRCDALDGVRVFVDLERLGKAERQAGRNTFISTHQMQDVARVKSQLRRAQLMVRVNPLHGGTAAELDAVLAQGADLVMLPMFHHAAELAAFSGLVAGRVPIVALAGNGPGALASLDDWVGTPGLFEVFVGLNDLHLSLGCSFMFEPLAHGASGYASLALARQHGRQFRFWRHRAAGRRDCCPGATCWPSTCGWVLKCGHPVAHLSPADDPAAAVVRAPGVEAPCATRPNSALSAAI